MTDDQQWRDLLVSLRAEQATGNPEHNRHVSRPDTPHNCSTRRHTLEAETIVYDFAHTKDRRR